MPARARLTSSGAPLNRMFRLPDPTFVKGAMTAAAELPIFAKAAAMHLFVGDAVVGG